MARLLIFCSANAGIDPSYNEAARKIVRAACAHGHTIVTGGTVKGTMGVIGDEVVAVGGQHVGVVPRFMASIVYPALTRTVWADTMSERQALMREESDMALALPGGIGTLYELIETQVLSKLGKYSGKIYVLNIGGFYEPLKALLSHYVATGMLDPSDKERIHFVESTEQMMEILAK